METDHIRLIAEEDNMFSVGTESEQVQISCALAAELRGKNQAQICGILRRHSEFSVEEQEIMDRWCRNINR